MTQIFTLVYKMLTLSVAKDKDVLHMINKDI
jgi:hypothetical protein